MTFEAKYLGRCGVCGEKIHPGDLCAYSEDVIVHGDCEASYERRKRPVCAACFMEIPLNGECECAA